MKVERDLFTAVSSQLVVPMYYLVSRCYTCQGWIFSCIMGSPRAMQ